MRSTSLVRWLLAAAFLAGCSRAAESPAVAPTASIATADVIALATTVPPTATATAQPEPAAAFNGGGMTNDEPVPPPVTATIETTAAPSPPATATAAPTATVAAPTAAPWSTDPHPLQIAVMRQQDYPGSPITIEQTLEPGANYSRYIASYLSDGYRIYALMTVPDGTGPDGTGPDGTGPDGAQPATGWPAIVFNHGYIAPSEYRTTERYVAYVDQIARSGYIVFKTDYRGWGNSEGDGNLGGGYGSPALTVDVLNAVAALKSYANADPNRIGMWGHSLGGQLALRAMVVSQDIKAGVIWGGVVPPYPDIIARWDRMGRRLSGYAGAWGRSFSGWVAEFTTKYGTHKQNPEFWATISPNTYLADLSGPIALHHATTDEMVPLAWAETLDEQLKAASSQPNEFYTYPGDNHNISANFNVAMQRTVAFFDKYVKGR